MLFNYLGNIAGDEVFLENGRLVPAPARLNLDEGLARHSPAQLTNLEVASFICYHGGFYTNDSVQHLGELIDI